jgi:hypothetical protein
MTGRTKKNPKMPLPLVRQLRKAAQEKNQKVLQEATLSGTVLSKSTIDRLKSNNNNKKHNHHNSKEEGRNENDKNFRCHGPSPSIGFMKNGIFRVSKQL